MFNTRNISNVRFETRDGRKGLDSEKPYDRIVAWATPSRFPDAWKDQISEEGILVAPFRVLPIDACTVTVRFKKVKGVLKGEAVREEGYIMMTSKPVTTFFGQEIFADIVGEGNAWVSASWMKSLKSEAWINLFFKSKPEHSPFEETGRDLRPYLLAKNPD